MVSVMPYLRLPSQLVLIPNLYCLVTAACGYTEFSLVAEFGEMQVYYGEMWTRHLLKGDMYHPVSIHQHVAYMLNVRKMLVQNLVMYRSSSVDSQPRMGKTATATSLCEC